MDSAAIAGLMIFSLSAAFTPGPNNVMLTSSAATFGSRRILPHILGIAAGFAGLAVAGGFGLAGLMKAVPQLHPELKFFGIVFLLYLAWKIGTATRATATGSSRPLGFLQAAAFQWIKPKG